MALYELEEGGSRKFYRVELNGTRVELHWGRIGAVGTRKVLEHATVAEAERAYKDERARRRAHGYALVQDEAAPRDATAARRAAATSKLAAAAALTTAPRFMFVHRKRGVFEWLEQRGGELWSASGKVGAEAAAVPTGKPLGSDRAALAACTKRMAALMADGFALEAFDAKPATKPRPNTPRAKRAKPASTAAHEDLQPTVPDVPPDPFHRRWAFFGEFSVWPSYHGGSPSHVAATHGATIVDDVGDADVVVLGDLRGAGRADAKKKAERAQKTRKLEILDEAAYRELVRLDLAGKRFAFIGGFDCSPTGDAALLGTMVERAGGVVAAEVDATLDYLVVGNRRGPSKIALLNRAHKLVDGGARMRELDEHAFMELVRIDAPLTATSAATGGELDFAGFMTQLYGHVDDKKLGRAMDMLRKDRFELYSRVDDERVYGVVHSQNSGGIYTSWLTSEGRYGCSQTSLEDCMGLQGDVCKHLLVLVVGLARTQQLPMDRALAWMRAAHKHGPSVDKTLCAETFIQYKGAAAGEVDWRPTETIPEDFYAL